jgi:adenosylcobyric acid synthase
MVVLPGTKSTLGDLAWLRSSGFAAALGRARGAGSAVVGLCGGYQMLGARVHDEAGVEGTPGVVEGLGMLPAVTTFGPEKTTTLRRGGVRAARGLLAGALDCEAGGYEIHMGQTTADAEPPFALESEDGAGATDGALSADGWVLGTYLHGLFHNDALRHAILRAVAERRDRRWPGEAGAVDSDALIESELDRLTDTVAAALDMKAIEAMVALPATSAVR